MQIDINLKQGKENKAPKVELFEEDVISNILELESQVACG